MDQGNVLQRAGTVIAQDAGAIAGDLTQRAIDRSIDPVSITSDSNLGTQAIAAAQQTMERGIVSAVQTGVQEGGKNPADLASAVTKAGKQVVSAAQQSVVQAADVVIGGVVAEQTQKLQDTILQKPQQPQSTQTDPFADPFATPPDQAGQRPGALSQELAERAGIVGKVITGVAHDVASTLVGLPLDQHEQGGKTGTEKETGKKTEKKDPSVTGKIKEEEVGQSGEKKQPESEKSADPQQQKPKSTLGKIGNRVTIAGEQLAKVGNPISIAGATAQRSIDEVTRQLEQTTGTAIRGQQSEAEESSTARGLVEGAARKDGAERAEAVINDVGTAANGVIEHFTKGQESKKEPTGAGKEADKGEETDKGKSTDEGKSAVKGANGTGKADSKMSPLSVKEAVETVLQSVQENLAPTQVITGVGSAIISDGAKATIATAIEKVQPIISEGITLDPAFQQSQTQFIKHITTISHETLQTITQKIEKAIGALAGIDGQSPPNTVNPSDNPQQNGKTETPKPAEEEKISQKDDPKTETTLQEEQGQPSILASSRQFSRMSLTGGKGIEEATDPVDPTKQGTGKIIKF